MSTKRYQVFISSTYADLKSERQKVIQTVMEMDCMPAGMELFPAVDQEQFDFIKSVIDDSDYYIIIMGGRYGSVNEDGVSYTEAEYDYAVSKGIKVIALVHADPTSLPAEKFDLTESLRNKLGAFREKLMTGRLIRKWADAQELPGLVALSLQKTIKSYPAVGWIRGDQAGDVHLISRTKDLVIENAKLTEEISQLKSMATPPTRTDIAGGDEAYQFKITYSPAIGYKHETVISATWNDLFDMVGFKMQVSATDVIAKKYIQTALAEKHAWKSCEIMAHDSETIGLQLKALGLVHIFVAKSINGGNRVWWKTTPYGIKYLSERRLIKKDGSS